MPSGRYAAARSKNGRLVVRSTSSTSASLPGTASPRCREPNSTGALNLRVTYLQRLHRFQEALGRLLPV